MSTDIQLLEAWAVAEAASLRDAIWSIRDQTKDILAVSGVGQAHDLTDQLCVTYAHKYLRSSVGQEDVVIHCRQFLADNVTDLEAALHKARINSA